MREIYNSEPNSTSLYLLLLLITAFRRPPEWHLEEPPAPPGHHSIIKQEDQINIQDQQHALASTTMPPGLDSPPVESLQKFQCRANAISCLSPWILTNIVVVMSVLLTFIAFAVNILINCWFIALNHILITPVHYVQWMKWLPAFLSLYGMGVLLRLLCNVECTGKESRVQLMEFRPAKYNWCRFVVIHWRGLYGRYNVLGIFASGYHNAINSNGPTSNTLHPVVSSSGLPLLQPTTKSMTI